MTYKKDLIQAIQDSDKWPSFDRPDFLDDLNSIADEVFAKNTIEGYLAALLVYHQLCEELIRLIIKDAQFFVQLSVFPAEMEFPIKRKMMFGQLIEQLEVTISFDEKERFVKKCTELNKLRIEIVHDLTKTTSLSQITTQVAQVKNLYDEIFELFEGVHDYFRACFHDFKKDGEWNE